MGNRHPNSCSIRANSRTASSECPPIAKKSSWIPTRSQASSSHHIAASVRSAGVRGSTTSARSSDDVCVREGQPGAIDLAGRRERDVFERNETSPAACSREAAIEDGLAVPTRRQPARPAGTTYASSRLSPVPSRARPPRIGRRPDADGAPPRPRPVRCESRAA